MTWALVIFTVVMAVAGITGAVVVTATESISEGAILNCMHEVSFGSDNPFSPGGSSAEDFSYPVVRSHEECEDRLHASGDEVAKLVFTLWLSGFVVLSLLWRRTRPR